MKRGERENIYTKTPSNPRSKTSKSMEVVDMLDVFSWIT
jgi:hypothetical protein